jgi:hypothetical protein
VRQMARDRSRSSTGGRWVEQHGPQHFGDNPRGSHNVGRGYARSDWERQPREYEEWDRRFFYDERSGDERALDRARRQSGTGPSAWSPYGGASAVSLGDPVWNEKRESHRGKGPKGFKRTDDRIREDVCEALADDHDVDASEVDVSVKDGEVTLSGVVKTRDMKRFAAHVAEEVRGVEDVHNLLRWRQQEQQQATQQAAVKEASPPTSSSNGTREEKRTH